MVQPTVPFRTIYTSCQYSTSCLDIKFGEQKAEQIMKSNYSGNTKSVNRKQMIDCSLMGASKFLARQIDCEMTVLRSFAQQQQLYS